MTDFGNGPAVNQPANHALPYLGVRALNPPELIRGSGAPTFKRPVGTLYVDQAAGNSYQLVQYSAGSPVWVLLGGAVGSVTGTTSATLNARVGQITITTPSIAGGATFAFTLTNSAIAGSSTQIAYSLTGGTTGAALSIQSYVNTAGQSVITIQNGTGATTNSASLKLNFQVLN